MTVLLVALAVWLALRWSVSPADRMAGLLEPPPLPQAHGLTELGVVDETWSVRALDGTTQRWDDPPSEGHPGEPINCRCVAEPVLSSLFEDL